MDVSTNPLLLLLRRVFLLTLLLGPCSQLTFMGVSDASAVPACYEFKPDCEENCPSKCASFHNHECTIDLTVCSTGEQYLCSCDSPLETTSTPGTSAQPPASCVESQSGGDCPPHICIGVYRPELCGSKKPYLCGCGAIIDGIPAVPGTPATPGSWGIPTTTDSGN